MSNNLNDILMRMQRENNTKNLKIVGSKELIEILKENEKEVLAQYEIEFLEIETNNKKGYVVLPSNKITPKFIINQ